MSIHYKVTPHREIRKIDPVLLSQMYERHNCSLQTRRRPCWRWSSRTYGLYWNLQVITVILKRS